MAFSSSKKKGPVSDINVTPLVDVMLVLLVIFMVTAPMMMSGIQLKLPKTKKVSSLNLKPQLVILSITAGEDYFLGKEKIRAQNLIKEVTSELSKVRSDVLYLRADYSLRYEKVAKLIASLKGAGISNIALVTEVEKTNP